MNTALERTAEGIASYIRLARRDHAYGNEQDATYWLECAKEVVEDIIPMIDNALSHIYDGEGGMHK